MSKRITISTPDGQSISVGGEGNEAKVHIDGHGPVAFFGWEEWPALVTPEDHGLISGTAENVRHGWRKTRFVISGLEITMPKIRLLKSGDHITINVAKMIVKIQPPA